jgi:hypothetical protein
MITQNWLITQFEQWPTAKLLPCARNARTDSEAQIGQIAASIKEFGFTKPILTGADRCRQSAAGMGAQARG